MSRVENLRKARTNYSVAWKEFMLEFQRDPTCFFCFFEGEDAKYYGFRIDLVVSKDKRRNLICGGREKVLHLYGLVTEKAEYNEAWVAFFVDNDFENRNDLPNDERIYATPCYSIENLYVTRTAFEKILRDEFKLSLSEADAADLQTVVDLYCLRMREFNDACEELNAWICLQRRLSRTQNERRLNLNDVKPKRLFSVSVTKVVKKYTFDSLKVMFPQADPVTKPQVAELVKEFKLKDRASCFRGKYLIEFLRLFIMDLKDDRVSKTPIHFTTRAPVKLNLSRANLLSELSQYADTPDCLERFLHLRAAAQPS